jgi:hypothetical protein
MATLETKNGKLLIDGKPVIKGWESFAGWFWFALEEAERGEYDLGDGKGTPGIMYFGLVQGFEEEYGYFVDAELRSMGHKVWPIKPQDLPHAGRRN